MKPPELLLSPERVKGVIRLLKEFLRSWKSPSQVESFPALSSRPFATLDTDIATAKAAYDKDPRNAAAEAKLAYAVAAARDAKYGQAGRVHLARLGWNSRVRGAFEGAKISKDHKLE